MIRILSEKDLLDAFRTLDRDEVMLPADLKFPFLIKDYLAWNEPSGYRAFLVFMDPTTRTPMGLVFRRDQTAGGANARMCEWCLKYGSGDEVGLLSAAASSNRRVGISLHRDLSCKAKVADGPNSADFPQDTTEHERVRRVLERMTTFARRTLF